MKVTGYRTRVAKLPGERTALGEIPGRVNGSFVVIQVQTDEGIEGVSFVGYAGYVAGMLAALKETVDALLEQTVGRDPFDVQQITERLRTLNGGASPSGLVARATSAIDVALWDIKGKALGMPCWKLLGAAEGRVRAYGSGHLWRHYTVSELAEWAPKLIDAGFRAMKLRLGAEDSVAKELERMRVLRGVVGPGIEIMVDINQGWSVHHATQMGRRLADFDLYWLEDPTHFQDYAGMARIAEALDLPVCSGEYHYGVVPFRHMLEARSVDIAMVDLFRVGGFTGFLKAAHLAEAFNIPVVSHLATELFMHVLPAVPNALYLEHVPWTFPLWKQPPVIEDGYLVIPEGTGLCLELDEERLAKFTA
jgi:L-alanine-DL-glutamate epimerase-like enolase superfamily enzyme